MSRYFTFALAIGLLAAGPSVAQVVTCAPTDTACRVQHNDAAALGTKLDALHTDMQALVKQLQAAPAATASTSTSSITSTGAATTTTPATTYAGDVVTAFDPCAGRTDKWTTLKIAPGVSMANAFVCAGQNPKLLLQPGTYNQVVHVPDGLGAWDIGGDVAAGGNADTVKVSGRGGCTVPQNNSGGCATKLAYGKGVFHASSPGTIHDLEVRDGGINAMGDHDGQAGIYFEGGSGGTVLIYNVMARNNENGIFANANATYDFVFRNVDFVGNGTDGGSHSSYISGGKSLTLDGIHDYGSYQGNNQKSRLPLVTATSIWSKSTQGRWIECADGCTLKITGGTFIGNTCCQNVFGNGTESTSKGPGNTTWTGSTIWLGRASNFANAGTFQASGVTLSCASGAFASNDHGSDLAGLPTCPANSNASPPADVPYISGAKS